MVLGSGSFIDGFEEGLIGAVTGEVRDLNLTFPENYSTPDLAGQAVVFTVTVNEVKEEVEAEKQSLIEEYTNMASYYGSLYGLDTETAIRYFLGFDSVEEFEAEMGNYAYDVVKNNMIVRDIAAKENIELTDEIYNAKVAEYSESYGYEDAESFVEAYGEDVVRESLLAELVMEFIIDNAVITDSQ